MSPLKGARLRRSGDARHGRRARGAVYRRPLTFALRPAAGAPGAARRTRSERRMCRGPRRFCEAPAPARSGGAGDAGAYRRLTSKLYPDLFVKVAEMRPGDLSTDLSTAVFLSEKLGRTWAAARKVGRGRLPHEESGTSTCRSVSTSRGGTVRTLLLAKSRSARALGRSSRQAHYRGERGDATFQALSRQ